MDDYIAGRKFLANGVCRTRRCAPSALGASVQVEQIFPGKSFQGVNPEAGGRFEIYVLQRSADGTQVCGVDVERPGEHVHHLGVG